MSFLNNFTVLISSAAIAFTNVNPTPLSPSNTYNFQSPSCGYRVSILDPLSSSDQRRIAEYLIMGPKEECQILPFYMYIEDLSARSNFLGAVAQTIDTGAALPPGNTDKISRQPELNSQNLQLLLPPVPATNAWIKLIFPSQEKLSEKLVILNNQELTTEYSECVTIKVSAPLSQTDLRRIVTWHNSDIPACKLNTFYLQAEQLVNSQFRWLSSATGTQDETDDYFQRVQVLLAPVPAGHQVRTWFSTSIPPYYFDFTL